MDNNGFVYIFSNTEYTGLLKIGKSKNNPIIRADQLTKNTGAIGTFKLEWSMEVPAMDIAEIILHYTFRKFHYQKEFFKMDIDLTKEVVFSTLDNFFKLDNKTQAFWIEKELRIKMKEKAINLKTKLQTEVSKQPNIAKLEKEFVQLEAALLKPE